LKEWKLIRIQTGYVAEIVYQRNRPEFNRAFGKPEDFTFESRDLLPSEQNVIIRQRRELAYPDLKDLADAIFHKERGSAAEMSDYLNRVLAVKESLPLVPE